MVVFKVINVEDILLFLVRGLPRHVLLHPVQENLRVVLHLLVLLGLLLGRLGLAPGELRGPQRLVRQPVQHEERLLAVALLQLARSEVYRDPEPPQPV